MKKLYNQFVAGFLFMAMPLGLWAQITMTVEFDPEFSLSQFPLDLGAWASGRQGVVLVVENQLPDTKIAFHIDILYEGNSLLEIFSCDSLDVPNGISRHRSRDLVSEFCFDPHPEAIDFGAILTSGRFPGRSSWSICYTVAWSVGGIPLSFGPSCEDVEAIAYQPSTLLMPRQGQVFANGENIQFAWTPIMPPPPGGQHDLLQIYEVDSAQNEIQAILNNLPLIQQEVFGAPIYIWPSTSMQIMPGDCVRFVCVLQPQGQDVLDALGSGSTEPVVFYVRDFRPAVTPYVPPCDSIDVGPDIILDSPDAPAVRIGCDPKPGCSYEWSSNVGDYHAYASWVKVRPDQDTYYTLFQTDASGACIVHDGLWVHPVARFEVNLTVDPCGNIQPNLQALPPAGNTRTANTQGGGGSGPARGGVAVILNETEYDNRGEFVGGKTPPSNTCNQPAPPPPGSRPTISATYHWNTGETTPTIHPTKKGIYACTVTEGGHSAVDSIAYTPSTHFHGGFPRLVATKRMRLGSADHVFTIRQRDSQGDQPAYNATGYQLIITDPNGYMQRLTGTTTTGFTDGEIRWDGGPDISGVAATPGNYQCRITLTNCTYPTPDANRKYKVAYVGDAQDPVSKARGQEQTMTFEFVVVKAKKQKSSDQ